MTARLNVSDLGRRWGAIWAQRAIVDAVKSDGAIPMKANAEMAGDFDPRVAELRSAGLDQPEIEAFAKAATDEMDQRMKMATRAIVL